jgi:PAS domain S-box-containing protein
LLREADLSADLLLDSLGEVLTFLDADLHILWANRAAGESVGMTAEKVVGLYCYEVRHGRDSPCEGCPVLEAIRSGEPRQGEIRTPNGRWWLLRAFPVRDADGRIVGATEAATEITARKRAEKAARKEEQRFRQIVETAQEGVWVIDTDARTTFVNQRMAEMLDYSVEEMQGAPLFSFMDEEAKESAEEKLKARQQGVKEVHEFTFRRKDGSGLNVLISTNPLFGPRGEYIGALAMVADITARKRTEEALRERDQRLEVLFEEAPDGYYLLEPDGTFVDGNRAAEELSGYSRKELIGRTFRESGLLPPDQMERALAALGAGLEGRPTGPDDFVLTRKDGTEVPVEIRTNPVTVGGRRLILGIARDISRRKRAQKAIRDLARLPSENPDPVLRIAKHGVVLFANGPAKGLLAGRNSGTGQQAPADWRRVVQEVMEQREVRRLEVRHGGKIFAVRFVPVAPLGYANLYGVDITERKAAEEALRESEQQFRLTFERSPLGAAIVTPDFRFQRVNDELCRITGYTEAELVSESMATMIHPDDVAVDVENGRRILWGEIDHFDHEERCVRKDGSIVWVRASVGVVRGASGEPLYFLTMIQDITDRKEAEESLRAERDRAQSFLDIAGVVIVALDAEGRVTLVNRRGCQILGAPRHKIIGSDWVETWVPPGERYWTGQIFAQLMAGRLEDAEYFENHVLTQDGRERLIAWYNRLLRDGEGNIVGTLSSGEDITERKETEEKLRQRETELRDLAAELSHVEERTRRRLAADLHDDVAQTLSTAKLVLQGVEDKVTEGKEAEELAQARRLVDEALGGTRTAVLDLGPPVLYELSFPEALEWLVDRTEAEGHVETHFEADEGPCPLAGQVRIALFRSTGELLRNVVRHAKADRVTVRLERGEEEVRITVEDDGVGFDSEAVRPRPDASGGFGLFGTRERVEYFGGRLEVDSAPGRGTRATLVAPLGEEEQEPPSGGSA